MSLILKITRGIFVAFFMLSVIGGGIALGIYLYFAPGLPSVLSLRDVQLQVPLRVYSRDGQLVAEYGEKRRVPLSYDEVPALMREAFLAAEDDRFFHHPGVDYQGLLRAAVHLVRTGEKGQGGSTITMQLARNFFLSNERTYIRKLREIFLALKIERELSKEDILALYLNKIYLGHRAYGVGAAAEVYYGKEVGSLDLAQMAMIAGLPKAPSAYNPITDPERALTRRNYVLGRMVELGYITPEVYSQALETPVTARRHRPVIAVEAPYVGEMVRSEMVSRYGSGAYTGGYEVYTTLVPRLQNAATSALRKTLVNYTERHGYRGPAGKLGAGVPADAELREVVLADYRPVDMLSPALVLKVEKQQAELYRKGGELITIGWKGLSWARPFISENARGPKPKTAGDILAPGDIVWVRPAAEQGWLLSQMPRVAGSLVSLDAHDGAILALVGGFDFFSSKFNRVTQAQRQPGSSFKPFIYSAALEQGFTPASIINDAPVVFDDAQLEGKWRPENYSGKFFGPTRLRVALTKSRNLVSIRLLRSIGVKAALEHARRFGFDTSRFSHDLSLALGSGSVSPLELARGYTVFANGGYLVDPYFIQRIEKEKEIIYQTEPLQACEPPCDASQTDLELGKSPEALVADAATQQDIPTGPRPAPRVLSEQNRYQMVSMMRDVVRRGTGRRAMKLKRKDLAGKTGTTNDQHDAWFSGYNGDIVTTAWVGFDRHKPLGSRETGSSAALPMWIDYMRVALEGRQETPLTEPRGMVTVRIDPRTGELAGSGTRDAIFETFRVDYVPSRHAHPDTSVAKDAKGPESEGVTDQLF